MDDCSKDLGRYCTPDIALLQKSAHDTRPKKTDIEILKF